MSAGDVRIIDTKERMYQMLAAGVFGNTTRQHFSVEDWRASGEADRYQWWGVRSLAVGGPCRLNCPREEVAATVKEFGCKVNISVMLDRICAVTLWADIYDSESDGLVVRGIEYPPQNGSWRALMPGHAKEFSGIVARNLLRKHLNANSLDDLQMLLERWPGHVIEISALERCLGIFPDRNTVVWEVRMY